MSRDKNYQKLLNSRQWWEVKRVVWQRAGGLCEYCKQEGIITPGVDCHHLRPVEKANSVPEMERLCYDPNNIRLLCVKCHIKAHQEMQSHTKEEVKANKKRQLERWIEKYRPKN